MLRLIGLVFHVAFYAGVGVLALCLLGQVFVWLDDRSARLLRQALGQYQNARAELNRHLSDCRAILFDEVQKRRPLDETSAFALAQAKSLRLIRQAHPAIDRLYQNDPNHRRYRAKEQIERLFVCCERCLACNKNAQKPVCKALQPANTVFVDLQFEGRDSDD